MSYRSKVGDPNAYRQVGAGNRYFNELNRPNEKDVKPVFNIGTAVRICHQCKARKPIKGGKTIDRRFFRCADCVAKLSARSQAAA